MRSLPYMGSFYFAEDTLAAVQTALLGNRVIASRPERPAAYEPFDSQPGPFGRPVSHDSEYGIFRTGGIEPTRGREKG
jgi:hypothetical protein